MVDREDFDEFLRARAEAAGADRATPAPSCGSTAKTERPSVVYRDKASSEE
jgi:geranylgeranyl reductase